MMVPWGELHPALRITNTAHRYYASSGKNNHGNTAVKRAGLAAHPFADRAIPADKDVVPSNPARPSAGRVQSLITASKESLQ